MKLTKIETFANEFVAYSVMRPQMAAGLLSERAIALATYALCGFANFASVGPDRMPAP